MRKFYELNINSLDTFPIKEKKIEGSTSPDLVFDFYIFPKIFINKQLVKKLLPYLKNNIELQEGAIELKHSDLKLNYSYLYIIGYENGSPIDINTHILRSEDNSSLFLSRELINEIRNQSKSNIIYRWH
ncbi:hypothetical protein N476_15095 [Pseudoalteromonas luteoviolacea H33]|uniref:Uncharacterized protein n=1 Tax=Pseudoalteromonas luteoviolacea H33 TaxID=1365251 RepID=A0A162AJ17_9GAMM|nr:hypothetical protein N476_15095 [Pseudoalteromonas luteoviolacea H33]KZN74835.1 hypothetical protein N477_21230 [Pseudoalteromonas luteoviolacea H33-S]